MAYSFRCAAVSIAKRTNAFIVSRNIHNGFPSKTILRSSSSPFSHRHTGYRHSIRATQGSGAARVLDHVAPKKEDVEQSSENWKIKMLYDGECPLCMKEVNMLRERNKSFGTIKFVDISSDDYSPEKNQGLDYKTVMGRIHAILSDGTVVTDVEIATIADAVYGIWAKYRLQITGRPPLEEVLEARKNKRDLCNDSKTCKT
ncbi:uncharacterized protein At5g50100, chloroplastic isoform X2 [Coffea arabica]|uniref:Uncharacterized protein At5g50100, chloroplastic isoform X2 n=1 Tax=Coffea arabica TaxID=13443 RepID=A0A6P6XFQ4_COFAR|nr:uncharacterized protein At5g50100, chloroplastic-like isoform X2 [Coffea arabica]